MNEHILRWNIEESDGSLQVCKGDHDKVLGCQFEPLTLADIGLMRKQIVELQQTVTEKTDKVNALWIENQTLQKRIVDLEKEVEVTEQVMNAYHRVLTAVPECPAHGECVPHAVQWIEKAKKFEQQNKLFRWLVDAWTYSDTPPSESDMKRMADAYAKIIEGGALK